MDIQMVDLKTQYLKIKNEVDNAIQKVINDSAFINGPYVDEFAHNLKEYLHSEYLIPCGNGTDALQLALMALELKPGDEVITTPFTFVATAETIVLLGLKPVFVDVDKETFNIDADKLEAAITERTRCIIPVHLFGQSCDLDPIIQLANKYSLRIIEDTAQSIGAYYIKDGTKQFCGTIGDIGTFSFFPSKNLGCYGDGGAVCTNDESLANKIKLYANHGSLKKYYYDNIGINSRLDGIQAAILNVKLNHLDNYNLSRQNTADRYDTLLINTEGLNLPVRAAGRNHVFHQYTITLNEKRDKVHSYLKERGIPTAVYYPAPLYTQSVYKIFKSKKYDYPVTESLCNSVLSLAMHTELNEDTQVYITDTIKEAIRNV